jgi:acetyltransferase
MGHGGSGLQGSRSPQPPDTLDLAQPAGECCLDDGTAVRFRPIEASDVAAYENMLCQCSRKSLYSRYERIITATPRAMAEELCRRDPNCDLTLVAEIIDGGDVPIVATAQLLSDPNREAAEYAVLVADPWQGRGLGGAMTSFCLDVARQRGIGRVIAEFLPDNMRMIRILETREFHLQRDLQERVVSGQKILGAARRPAGTEPAIGLD